MPSLLNPWVLLGALVSLMLSFGAGVYSGHHYGWLQEQAAVVTAQTGVIEKQEDQQIITAATSQAAAEAKAEVQYITQTIIKEVPVYVSRKADAACVVPRGFVRLHDAAARGVRPVPDPAGESNDDPSGVELSAVQTTVAGNYGTCQQTRSDLIALQGWLREQQAAAQGKRP